VRVVRRPLRRARIEIVPLIDTVFFLLVFFMMASLAMSVYRGLPVNLPAAASGQTAVADSASITVTRDGTTYLDREPMPIASLSERVRRLLGANPGLAVIVNADADVVHGRVVAVLDAVREAGATRLAIAIAPRETRP
jgi:biopolymer transport protein ExbD